MGTIKNFRTTADVTMNTRLKDGGIYIDWASLTDIRVWIYSDAQKALAGRVDVTIDQQDSTKAVLVYAGTKAQYPGVNRLIVQARYNGSLKTYDKPVFNFVPRTAEATGNVTIDEPETDVEIVVQDVSSSILDATILAALAAADRANEAAEAAEHMTDIHQGPPGPAGKAPYIDETTGNWFVWDDEEDAYVDSEIHAQGATGNGIASWSVVESDQDGGSNVVTVTFTNGNSETFTYKNGHTGATPQISIGTVETGAAGSEAEASMGGTAAAPLLNLKIPKGDPGVAEVCYKHVTTLPTAAAGTMNALYLVDTQTANVYDVYYTSYDGSAYSWVQLGTTTVNLSDYATKTELNQLEAEVHNLSGKYYGLFTSSSNLPEGDTPGYAFVGSEAPFSIWNFDGEEWADTGATIDSVQGEPGTDGVGFESVESPDPADGTAIITLSNGDTITLDLNHNHPAYYSKVLGGAQPVGGFLPDVVYSLGTLSGTITFSLAAAVTGNVNHYFWMFDTSSTAPTITWPAGLTWAAGSAPTVAANKHYEVSILGGIAYYSEV